MMEANNLFDALVKKIYLGQLKEYEATKRLKPEEHKMLREWVEEYNSVYSNPFYVYGDDGRLLDYITAYRRCVKEHKTALRKELKEYEQSIPDLTDTERENLHDWVSAGNSVYDNPYYMVLEGGCPVDYIEALRTMEEEWESHRKSMQDTAGEIPF